MQFKTLVLAAVAVTAVNAQFINNTCGGCLIGSILANSFCATLNSTILSPLVIAIMENNNASLSSIVQSNPAVKACICNWALNIVKPSGPVLICYSAPICVGPNTVNIGPLFLTPCASSNSTNVTTTT
ncbi:hypothetical protein BGX26_007955 [Mortierella sp. AD094]|nr:hypothetical protein BGX26_007955 [Mortierella sp. AD094]